MFSTQPPFFPAYVESDEFLRPGLWICVYFSDRDSYLWALQDLDSIPDAAYFGSLEHSFFLQNCLPFYAVPADTSLRHAPFSISSRPGLLPVRDPQSWALRYAQVISSRVAETLPTLLDSSLPTAPEHLLTLVHDALVDLGLPQSVDTSPAAAPVGLPPQALKSVSADISPTNPLNTSHPNFFDNLLRFAGQLLDDFGVRQDYELLRKFPLDSYFQAVRGDWEQFRLSAEFDGQAVEFQVIRRFDQYQREHLGNVFFPIQC
jgi:hypothetical protein